MKNEKNVKIESITAHCYICHSKVMFNGNSETRYWLCPQCKSMNNCENLIKAILNDTILDVKFINEEQKNDK